MHNQNEDETLHVFISSSSSMAWAPDWNLWDTITLLVIEWV
jgi:hypothetical protein